MNSWQLTPYSVLYISAACISFIISVIAWRMRPVRATNLFGLLAFSVGIWVTGYLLGFFNKDITVKLIMLRIEYLGILSSGYLWLLFASSYTKYDKWLKPWVKIVLAIIPILSYIQILTVEYHDFYYLSYTISQLNDLIITKKVYGPGFYIATSFNYLVIITGTALLIWRIMRMPARFRRQNILLILIVLVILSVNFIYISGNNIFKPYDPTPISFTLAGILFLIAIYFHHFLDVVPVAYNLVFNNMKNGVVIIDKRDHVLEINFAAELIFKTSSKQIIGKHIIELFSNSGKLITSFLKENEIKSEITLGSDDRIYELQISILEDYTNTPIGKIVMLYDINEQKQVQAELDAFARTVAHDLKNPLSNITGFSDFLLNPDLSEEKRLNFVEKININAFKMNKIIDALLLLARIRKEENIYKSILDMKEIVDSAVSRLSESIKEHKAKIIKPDSWPFVLGDPILIEEVWVNYISNAVKYGGKPPVVTLSHQRIGNEIQMRVKDNGAGINEEEQSFLFLEFSRLKKHKDKISGHGLGLSIVQSIILKLGGKVGLECKEGTGSIFFFTLPAVKNSEN